MVKTRLKNDSMCSRGVLKSLLNLKKERVRCVSVKIWELRSQIQSKVTFYIGWMTKIWLMFRNDRVISKLERTDHNKKIEKNGQVFTNRIILLKNEKQISILKILNDSNFVSSFIKLNKILDLTWGFLLSLRNNSELLPTLKVLH